MDILRQHLEDRDAVHQADEASRARSGRDQEREQAFRVWTDGGRRPEERLIKFDTWLRRELESRIDWAWAGEAKAKRIEQCRIHLEGVVLRLWQRGWMLDGRRLAAHLQGLLDSVAAYQRKGGILDFWAYFKASADRYVGGNAEELREESMRAGTHIGQLLTAIGAKAEAPKLGDLLQQRSVETMREKIAKERKRLAARTATQGQQSLF